MTNEFHPGMPVGRRFALGSLGMLGLAACTPAVGPAGQPVGGNSLAAALEADPRFSTFVWLIKEQGMWQTLRDAPKQYTIFAPTNEAFDKLPQGTVATLVQPENKPTLVKILTYHVVAGRYSAADLMKLAKSGGSLTTVQGETLKVSLSGRHLILTDAKGGMSRITISNVFQSNGVIHVVDTVLMPS